MRAGTKTLADHLARCVEYGDCLLWPHAATQNGLPEARLNGETVSLRRVVYMDHHKVNADDIAGLVIWPICDEQTCLCAKHLRASTRAQWSQLRADRGLAKHKPGTVANITAAARKRASNVLNLELAREIRQSDEGTQAICSRLGLEKSRVITVRRGSAWREQVQGASVFSGPNP